jgi:hypothetical protein
MMQDNNTVEIKGVLASDMECSHIKFGESFYTSEILCERESGARDIIPITISSRLFPDQKLSKGMPVRVLGQFRSVNKTDENGRVRLILSVFVYKIEVYTTNNEPIHHSNFAGFDGFICKKPTYRQTPGGREISDILLAVNRGRRTDYIPCIAWGRNAKYISNFEVGKHIYIEGRIQSREYRKCLDNGETISRTAYEVSIVAFSELDN